MNAPTTTPFSGHGKAGARRWTFRAMSWLWLTGLSNTFAQSGPIDQWTFASEFAGGLGFSNRVGALPAELVGPLTLTSNPEALALDGQQNYLRMAASMNTAQLPARDLTAEAWVALGSGTRWGGIVGCIQDNGAFEKGWLLGYDDSHFTMALSSDGSLTYMTPSHTFELNRWYHVAGTYDGASLKLYVNGILTATSAAESGPIDYAPAPYVIGAYLDDNEFYPMHGITREVGVYDRALSGAEVLARYNAQKALFPATTTQPPGGSSSGRLALGPYARYLTPDTVSIRWRTAEPSASVIEYGPGQLLGARVEDPTLKQVHQVTLTGLELDRVYYYRVLQTVENLTRPTEVFTLETDLNLTVAAAPDVPSPFPADDQTATIAALAQGILDLTGIHAGYCLDYGCGDGRLAYELARRSSLYVIGVSESAEAVASARAALRKAGLYGTRVTILHSSLNQLPHTKDIFNLAVSSEAVLGASVPGQASEVIRLLRPSGGVALLGLPPGTPGAMANFPALEAWLPASSSNAVVDIVPGYYATIVRQPLAGIGEWSHTFGDPAQSANSRDQRVRGSAMKLQWFGQPGPRGMVDRQARMPSPLAVQDHLYVPGNDRLFGVDSYNGHIRWTVEIPGMRRVNIPRDSGNLCADGSTLFVAVRGNVLRIEGHSGELVQHYGVAPPPGDRDYHWGYLASVENRLYGSATKSDSSYSAFDGPAFWYDGTNPTLTAKVCSDNFFCLAKADGQTLWSYRNGVIINSSIAIGGGRVYFVESRHPTALAQDTGRIAHSSLWQNQFLVALDAQTGAVLWEQPVSYPADPVVFFLCYADEKVVLDVSAGSYRLYTYHANNGQLAWQKQHPWGRNHHGGHMYHPIIAQGAVYLEPYAYALHTGAVVKSGLPARGGCHTMCASENTFLYIDWDYDKGSMYLWDLDTNQRRQLAGTRSSCWLSYISGGGMVLAPTASSGCTCRYPLQTSMGFASP